MPVAGVVIVAEWVAIVLGAVAFGLLYGRPGKYGDREMAWHIAAATAAAGLQPIGLLLGAVSLWLPVATEGLAMAIVYWRVALLVQTRRAARRSRQRLRSGKTA